jgi:hypothetical protein
MLTDDFLNSQGPFPRDGKYGIPLAWIIGEDVLYALSLREETASIFLDHDSVEDITNEYDITEGLVIKFMKDGNEIERLTTSEYFGNLLLSSPLVINLFKHKKGWVVTVPSKFIDNEFVFLDVRRNLGINPWMTGREIDECDQIFCGCQNKE